MAVEIREGKEIKYMTFKEILHKFQTESFTEKEKGTKFERLMKLWLKTDPRYNEFRHVWLWDEFPGRKDFGSTDIGIDLVAKTEQGDYWAIQCKCYKENTYIDKAAVDSFISTSAKTFLDADTFQTVAFSNRLWISTSNKWSSKAEETLKNQTIPVDKKSGIKNDPNDWSREHKKPRYILDLLQSVINVSCKTVDIVNNLPKLKF